ANAAVLQRALGAIGLRGAGGVGSIVRLPDARGRKVAFRHAIEGAVEPAVPFGRHAAGIVGAVVDNPAALQPGARMALGERAPGTVVAVALRIGADMLAMARRIERGADGGAVPPGEDLGEDT